MRLTPRTPLRLPLSDEPRRLATPPWVHPLWVAAVAIPAVLASFIYLGTVATAIIGASAVVAFAGWLTTTYHRPAPRRLLPWCIATIVTLVVQAWEQWSHGYADTLMELLPDQFVPPVVFDEATWFVVFPLTATVLFLFGAMGLFFHHPAGNYLAWLTFSFAGAVGLSHLGVLMAIGELRYLPGMYSALPTVAVAALGMRRLVTDRIDRPHP